VSSVVWHVTTSLDGFIAGPDDTMAWAFQYYDAPNRLADEVMRETGAILAGRRWFDVATER
jgi:dihydrofolate reductase